MQPWLTGWPIEAGSFVPCSPITPPHRHVLITFEYPERPYAYSPYTVVGDRGFINASR